MAEASQFPEKWIKYGDVVMVFADPQPENCILSLKNTPEDVLAAFNQSGLYSDVRCILLHRLFSIIRC